MDFPPPRPEWTDDPRTPHPRAGGLSPRPAAGRSLPTLVLLVLLPILVIGFFVSVVSHLVVIAVILAALAFATVVRLALTNRARG